MEKFQQNVKIIIYHSLQQLFLVVELAQELWEK
jgi:hypothetical protein